VRLLVTKRMKPWNLRSPEVANLLNPAFCGHVLYTAVASYADNAKKPMPYVLSFVILPLVLHHATCITIEGRTSQLQLWLAEHPEVKVRLAERARQLVPFAREASEFLLQTETLRLDATGGLEIGAPLRRMRRSIPNPEQNEECLKKAKILGRWLSTAGSAATIYASLGVKP
jgi:Family of unknown function (DUF6521)